MSHKQMTLAMQSDKGFEKHRKPTRRDEFLAQMDKVVPWAELCALIAPVYPQGRERGGRRPIGLERMLRIYFLQQWYDLSDPAVEEALYDSQAMRRFVGIDLGREGHQTRPRCASSGIGWKRMSWASGSSSGCGNTWRRTA